MLYLFFWNLQGPRKKEWIACSRGIGTNAEKRLPTKHIKTGFQCLRFAIEFANAHQWWWWWDCGFVFCVCVGAPTSNWEEEDKRNFENGLGKSVWAGCRQNAQAVLKTGSKIRWCFAIFSLFWFQSSRLSRSSFPALINTFSDVNILTSFIGLFLDGTSRKHWCPHRVLCHYYYDGCHYKLLVLLHRTGRFEQGQFFLLRLHHRPPVDVLFNYFRF